MAQDDGKLDSLRRDLYQVIFRGRGRPSVGELLLDNSKRDSISGAQVLESLTSCPPEDVLRLSQVSLLHRTQWERVSLNLCDDEHPSQTRLNLLICNPTSEGRNKTVVLLHGTGKCAASASMFYHATRFLEQDFTVVLINSRYHGCRIGSGSDGKEEYLRQLIRAWRQNSCPKSANCYPFIYDTAADLCSVGDYLLSREDVCPEKLGITGISLGGMHAWFAAAIDTRWKAIAPLIGVQSFKYAINNHCFEARVATLQEVFDAAAGDLSQKKVDCDVVQAVWDRICPGLLQSFDAECSLPLLAPRPVFVGNGEVDPRCPISGVEEAVKQARNSFGGSESWLDLKIYPNVGHCVTEEMWRDCVHFFINAFHDEHGKAGQIGGRPSNDVAGVEVCQKSCTEQPESKTIVQ